MKVSLIIPFASEDERRIRIFEWVLGRWRSLFPDWEIFVGWDNPDDFNRSTARNLALLQAAESDVIVVSDADTACNVDQINVAIDLVVNDKAPWVIAHTDYYSLTQRYTDRLLETRCVSELSRPYESNWVMHSRSEAGVLVIPSHPLVLWDSRFNGWGFEDNAWAVEMNRKVGQYKRTRGDMLHLWHERGFDFDQPHIKDNERLYKEIRDGV